MGRAAPHADAIRAVRPRADRARRAHTDASRLRSLPAATHAGSGGLAGELVAEIILSWPGLGDTAGQLVQALSAEAHDVRALEEELGHLRHEQHEELHRPEWADAVAEIQSAARTRDGIAGDLSRANAWLIGARAVGDALAGTLAEAEALDAAAATGLYEAASASFFGLLSALDIGHLGPAAPVQAAAEPAQRWLTALQASMRSAIEELEPEVARLQGELAALDHLLEELLG